MPMYYEDPYLRELKVRVISRRGDFIKFDDTILFPGGGGQPHDTGYFKGDSFLARITDVRKDGDGIWHRIEILEGEPGDEGTLILDWERRYYLMKSHTGEHVLYRSLEKVSNIKFVKVEFDIPESILFVEGNVTLNEIERAENIANSIIGDKIQVTIEKRSIQDTGDVRIRRDRIRDEEVRIVRIGDFDSSACSGIHVKDTGEIGGIYVKRLRYSRYNEIIFMVDSEARREIEFSKNEYRRIRHLLNEYSSITERIKNMKEEIEKLREDYFRITETMFSFEKKIVDNVNVYYTTAEIGDFKGIQKRAYSISESERCVIIIGRKSMGRVEVINSTGIDFSWSEFIVERNLKGGGKVNFMISVPPERFESIFNEIMDRIEKGIRGSPL
ncbi:MAG: hypothetical protein ACPLVI_03600 [Thermoplasmata archaeon]